MTTNIADLRKAAKLPVKQSGGATVAQFFELNKATIKAVLPRHVTPERMLKIALGAIRTTPKLQEATSESLFGAVVVCAQLGLEPNTPMQHAHLIPFRNNAMNRTDVQVIIGYRGLIDLARRSGQIISISAQAVYANDEFSYEYGLEEHCKHVPAEGDRGEITHFYAVAKLVGGGYAFEVMSRSAVEKIRDNSQNWKTAVRFKSTGKSVWTQHFDEMGRKTLIRRLYKYLPTSIEMATANDLDAKGSTGEVQGLEDVLTGDYHVVEDDSDFSEDAGAPVVDDQGEVFDPELHLDPDKRNKDGSFTKKKKRRGQGQLGSAVGESTIVMDAVVASMKAATNMDELNDARERANAPGLNLDDGQIGMINSLYNARQTAIKSSEGGGPAGQGDEDPGASDFGSME
jgi:recombination protein RecT